MNLLERIEYKLRVGRPASTDEAASLAAHGIHHGMAPCHEQPGKQGWHVACALRHPIRFARSRGPVRWRYAGERTA